MASRVSRVDGKDSVVEEEVPSIRAIDLRVLAAAQLVVHVNVAGRTIDIPMRYRATAQQPEREFWVAKWVVPQDTPIGIIRYTVTATDKYGRAGEFKPFEVQASQLTIVE